MRFHCAEGSFVVVFKWCFPLLPFIVTTPSPPSEVVVHQLRLECREVRCAIQLGSISVYRMVFRAWKKSTCKTEPPFPPSGPSRAGSVSTHLRRDGNHVRRETDHKSLRTDPSSARPNEGGVYPRDRDHQHVRRAAVLGANSSSSKAQIFPVPKVETKHLTLIE